ncbi:MAG: transglutaminase family protein [Haliea sp.]|nr:MAG: transglutaminase family protein [Haliea sp.]
MKLTAACTMTVTAPADCPVIAMLRPRSGLAQWTISERYELDPWVPTTEYVDSYGNLCQRLVIPRGQMRIAVEMTMQVEDQIAVAPDAPFTPIHELPDDALLYLLQSRYCPSDKMQEKALAIVGDAPPGYAQAEAIRGWIHQNLTYEYGVSCATTDAMDTLNHGAGVCRDFAHVGIALCRSLQIPARMVVGYLHELDPMDLHAWFEAFVGGRWYTFDATQDAPRGGRIVLAYGRDAADVAFLSDYAAQPLEMGDMRVEVTPG